MGQKFTEREDNNNRSCLIITFKNWKNGLSFPKRLFELILSFCQLKLHGHSWNACLCIKIPNINWLQFLHKPWCSLSSKKTDALFFIHHSLVNYILLLLLQKCPISDIFATFVALFVGFANHILHWVGIIISGSLSLTMICSWPHHISI